MFDKGFLTGKVLSSLEKGGYKTMQMRGCFDIVASKGEETILIKVLMNVDALKEEQAMSLRTVAYFMNTQSVIISIKNNRESLEDIVYSRFEIPVMTPKLFDSVVIQGGIPATQSAKGRHTVEIDAAGLRDRRKEMGFTLESLAEEVGITKKAAYEIENRRVNPTEDTVKKLENILSRGIRKPYEIKNAPITYMKPGDESQENLSKELSRIGIDNSSVYSSPFENVGKEKFMVVSSISHNIDKIKQKAASIKKLSGFFSSKAVFITKNSKESSVNGVAVVLESELPEISSSKDFKKLIEEKE